MMPNKSLLQKLKQLYRAGKSREQLVEDGYPRNYVNEAIRQANQSFKLPSVDTPTTRCKCCGYKVYVTNLLGGLCTGCMVRKQVNEERKGQFQV